MFLDYLCERVVQPQKGCDPQVEEPTIAWRGFFENFGFMPSGLFKTLGFFSKAGCNSACLLPPSIWEVEAWGSGIKIIISYIEFESSFGYRRSCLQKQQKLELL